MRPILKSNKLDDVCYESRGPALEKAREDWVLHVAGQVTLLPRIGIGEAAFIEATAAVERDDVVIAERGVLAVCCPIQANNPVITAGTAGTIGFGEESASQKYPTDGDDGAQRGPPLGTPNTGKTAHWPAEEFNYPAGQGF